MDTIMSNAYRFPWERSFPFLCEPGFLPVDGETAEAVKWIREAANDYAFNRKAAQAAGRLNRAADLLEALSQRQG